MLFQSEKTPALTAEHVPRLNYSMRHLLVQKIIFLWRTSSPMIVKHRWKIAWLFVEQWYSTSQCSFLMFWDFVLHFVLQLQKVTYKHICITYVCLWIHKNIMAAWDPTFRLKQEELCIEPSWCHTTCLAAHNPATITSVSDLTSRRRCCECPVGWLPLGQTIWLLPAHRWAVSPLEDPNQQRCCCKHRRSPDQVRELWATRRTESHRTPAVCHGQPPSPLHWSLGRSKVTDRKGKRSQPRKRCQSNTIY